MLYAKPQHHAQSRAPKRGLIMIYLRGPDVGSGAEPPLERAHPCYLEPAGESLPLAISRIGANGMQNKPPPSLEDLFAMRDPRSEALRGHLIPGVEVARNAAIRPRRPARIRQDRGPFGGATSAPLCPLAQEVQPHDGGMGAWRVHQFATSCWINSVRLLRKGME
jgi:hypothetical protein